MKNISGKNNPFYGKTHSPEIKEILRKQRLGTKLSEKQKKKISKNHSKHNMKTYNIFNPDLNILKTNITTNDALDIIKCGKSYFYEVARGEKSRALGWEVELYLENEIPFKNYKQKPKYKENKTASQIEIINEIWKKINDFPYKISNFGRVKNNDGLIMRTRVLKNGYESLSLVNNNNEKFNKTVHRLVAEAFIPNPENKETVNHKDGNKLNNLLENLEWNTQSENVKHAFDTGLKTMPSNRIKPAVNARKKKILCVETGVIYESSQEAGRQTNIDSRQIRDAAGGKQKTAHGYHWKYLEKED
jgi:hypothetical protein